MYALTIPNTDFSFFLTKQLTVSVKSDVYNTMKDLYRTKSRIDVKNGSKIISNVHVKTINIVNSEMAIIRIEYSRVIAA